jgi:hypothetical protein
VTKSKNISTTAGNKANVNDLHSHHPKIRAEDFRSPLVRRLTGMDHYSDGQKTIMNSYRPDQSQTTDTPLVLSWSGLKEDHDKCIKTYQEPVITEFATLGLACVLLNNNAQKEITEVTRRGEKADYWIGDREEMLEVSGQQSGAIETLCRTKSQQLLDNPYGKEGYVCVAIYDNAQARLWHYNKKGTKR